MSIEDRLAALEARCQAAEDHLAILNLVNSYGPLVDSGSDDDAAALWVEGGSYNFGAPGGGTNRVEAPTQLAGMYQQPTHLELVATGSAHLTATPKVTVDGDAAQAVAYSLVIKRDGDHWFVWRAAVNHWNFTRTPAGWRIQDRFNRTLDGSPESHATMRKVLAI